MARGGQMLDAIALKLSLRCKLSPGQLLVCQLDPQNREAQYVVAISQTLDKLVVYEPLSRKSSDNDDDNDDAAAAAADDSHASNVLDNQDTDGQIERYEANSATSYPRVFYISVKDVIRSVAAIKSSKVLFTPDSGGDSTTPGNITDRDLLLIGCSNSVLVYDALTKSCLLDIRTPISIDTISDNHQASRQINESLDFQSSQLVVCGGAQKLLALKFERQFLNTSHKLIDAELSSERSTSDTITCLAQGRLNNMDLVLTGSREQKIRAYQLDPFDQNIQACRLTITESSQVKCLCAINTAIVVAGEQSSSAMAQELSALRSQRSTDLPSTEAKDTLLPSLSGQSSLSTSNQTQHQSSPIEEMNYFAYGLASCFVGLYRLIPLSTMSLAQHQAESASTRSAPLTSERVWGYKCKSVPVSMLMFDINGDGLDELLIGFENGRIEVRSALTGQLLGATRCFRQSSDRLVGLAMMSDNRSRQALLIVCSTSGTLVGFKSGQQVKQRIPLRGYEELSRVAATNSPLLASKSDNNYDAANNECNNRPLAENEFVSTDSSRTTIGNEERRGGLSSGFDVFMMSASVSSSADLHIELRGDDAKPTKCDTRQSVELLQKINALHSEQMELKRKACHIYHHLNLNPNVDQALKFFSSEVSVAHRWDFDLSTLYLRLAIVVSSCLEEVKLVELEEESKNLLASGYLLAQPTSLETTTAKKTTDKLSGDPANNRSYQQVAIVIPLRSARNEASRLKLSIYCVLNRDALQQVMGNNSNRAASLGDASHDKVSQVYRKQIDVPKYSMFTFLPEQTNQTSEHSSFNFNSNSNSKKLIERLTSTESSQSADIDDSKYITLEFPLKDNSMALQRAQSIGRPRSESRPEESVAMGRNMDKYGNEAELDDFHHLITSTNSHTRSHKLFHPRLTLESGMDSFEINLLDVRHTLEKLSALDKSGTTDGQTNSRGAETFDAFVDQMLSVELEQEKLKDEGIGEREREGRNGQSGGEQLEQQQWRLSPSEQQARLACKSFGFPKLVSTLRIAYSHNRLTLQCESSDLVVDLVQSLVIDRLHLEPAAAYSSSNNNNNNDNDSEPILTDGFVASVKPLLEQLDSTGKASREVEESARRIQTELYESADYAWNLMQQFAIANELNEFATARGLLSELSMMLAGTQNAARAHCLNNDLKARLSRQVSELVEKITFLSGHIV